MSQQEPLSLDIDDRDVRVWQTIPLVERKRRAADIHYHLTICGSGWIRATFAYWRYVFFGKTGRVIVRRIADMPSGKPSTGAAPGIVSPPRSTTGMTVSAVQGMIKMLEWGEREHRVPITEWSRIVVVASEKDLPPHIRSSIAPEEQGRLSSIFDPSDRRGYVIAYALGTPKEMMSVLTQMRAVLADS